MKITDMRCQLYTAPYADERVPKMRSYGVVAISTEDGRTGYGEPYAAVNMPTVFREVLEQLKPLIMGQDAESLDCVLQRLYRVAEYFDHRGMVYCCIGAIDWALHDLAAQRAGVPLCRFLNPASADSVQVYASGGLFERTAAEIENELLGYLDKGFRTTKIRAGGNHHSPQEALHHVYEVFKRIPASMRVGVDIGQQVFLEKQWTYEECAVFVDGLANIDLLFLEDPLLIHDYEGYCQLRAKGCVPIAGGEMFAEPCVFERYIRGDAWDVVQPDAAVLPGPAASMQVGRFASTHQKPVIMHGWAGPIAQMQNIHIALALDSCDMVEYCMLYHPFLHEAMEPVWDFSNGRLAAPEAPGLGLTLRDDWMNRYAFAGVSSLIA